jgi:hypothetical protein
MPSRLRILIALLLLLAAGAHPLVHVASQDCPCVHGATAQLDAPSVTPLPPTEAKHVTYVATFVSASLVGELPARAPPAV